MRVGKVSNGPNQSKKNFSGQKRKPRVAIGSYVHIDHTIQSKVRCFWPMKAAKVAIGFYVGDHTNQIKVRCFWPMAAAQVAIGFYVDHTNQSKVFWLIARVQVAIANR